MIQNTLIGQLNETLASALQKNLYVDTIKSLPPSSWTLSPQKKSCRLNSLFQEIQATAKLQLEQKELPQSPSKEIKELQTLDEQCDRLYMRYERSTHTWRRLLLKEVAKYTPAFLKRFLPTCFSNKMEDAEKETKKNYEMCKTWIQSKKLELQNLERQPRTSSPAKVSPPTTASSKNSCIESIIDHDPRQELLKNITQAVTQLNQISACDHGYATHYMLHELLLLSSLLKKFLSEEKENNLKKLEAIGLKAQATKVLLSQELALAKIASDYPKIVSLLANTPWKEGFEKTLYPTLFFSVSSFGKEGLIQIKSKDNKVIRPREFENYSKKAYLRVQLNSVSSTHALEKCVAFLEDPPTHFLPYHVKVECAPDFEPTAHWIALLQKLTEKGVSVSVAGIKTLTLCSKQEESLLSLCSEEYEAFTQALFAGKIWLQDLVELSVDEGLIAGKSADHFSSLLKLVPSFDLLKQAYAICPEYAAIELPFSLLETEWVDATGLSPAQLLHLCSRLFAIKALKMNDVAVTDQDCQRLVKLPSMQQLRWIDARGCGSLTTDAVFSLMRLKKLEETFLPDFPLGKKYPLSRLPVIDNPHKIALFYLSSANIRPLISQLYTGPLVGCALFQIPLARLKEPSIFLPNQEFLDQSSVAYWLEKEDFHNIQGNNSIHTLFAHSMPKLTDTSLVAFVRKFPKASTLYLDECPYISNEGIAQLLQIHPELQTLSLTGCPQITAKLFQKVPAERLQKLQKLDISGTLITASEAAEAKKLFPSICFSETLLKISDEELTSLEAFIATLREKDLSIVKTVDCSHCSKLSNDMLRYLLSKLNEASLLIEEGLEKNNPSKLNAASLNIEGCSNISTEAFETPERKPEEKIETLFLGNLQRLAIGGTKINQELIQSLYPSLTIQKHYQLHTFEIDPVNSLAKCQAYSQEKREKKETTQSSLAAQYPHHRTILALFSENSPVAERAIVDEPFNPYSDAYADFTLGFQTALEADGFFEKIHSELLSTQSTQFFKWKALGGIYSKENHWTLVNQHATKEALIALKELLYNRLQYENLDWKVAIDLAELIGPKNLCFSKELYNQLLNRFHNCLDCSYLDYSVWEEKLLALKALEDDGAFNICDSKLVTSFLSKSVEWVESIEPDEELLNFSNIAREFNLPTLTELVEELEDQRTTMLLNRSFR